MARNKSNVDEELTQEFNWSHYRRLGSYVRPYKQPIFKVLLIIILTNIATMLGPYFTKIAIDTIIPQKNIQLLGILGVVFLLSLLFIAWCMRYRILAITEIGQDILKDMRYAILNICNACRFHILIIVHMAKF